MSPLNSSFLTEQTRLLEFTYPGEQHRYFSSMKIGDGDPLTADKGAMAILSGIKTATTSAFWHYPDGRIPFVGALSVLLDGQDRPCAIVETDRVEIMPFGSTDQSLARDYGEGDQTLHWFRMAIGDWYRASAARHGETFSNDTLIICEGFRVVKQL